MFVLHEPPPEPREYQVTSLAYAPDGSELSAGVGFMPKGRGSSRGLVLQWDLPFGSPPVEVHVCRNFVRAVGYSPRGDWFALGSGTRNVHCTHRSSGREVTRTSHTRPPVALALGGDAPCLLSGSADKYANTGGGEALVSLCDEADRPFDVGQASGTGVTAVAWGPDENLVAVAQRSRVELRKLWTRSLRKLVTTAQPVSLDFSPDGTLLAAAMGWTARTWRLDVDGKPEVRDLKGHDQRVNVVAFHPHEPLLASAGTDHTVRLWDTHSGREVARYDWGIGPVRSLAFHPDGLTAAAGGNGIVVFDVE